MKDKPKKPTKQQSEQFESYQTSLQTVKTSLKSIVKHQTTHNKINEIVCEMNELVIHTYQFIKLFYLYQLENKKTLPDLNEDFINCVMKVICDPNAKEHKNASVETVQKKKVLKEFYKKHYKKLRTVDKTFSYENLNTVLDYLSIGLITAYENHISTHFVKFFNRFINVYFDKDKVEDEIRKKYETILKTMTEKTKDKKVIKRKREDCNKLQKEEISAFRKELKHIKYDVPSFSTEYKADKKYHKKMNKIKSLFFTKNHYEEDSAFYDVKCKPVTYLPMLIQMSIFIEEKGYKTFSCFPLRQTCVPKYIPFDTTTIIYLFRDKDKHGKQEDFVKNGNLVKRREEIWKFFFRTEKTSIFGSDEQKYRFNHQIRTDGLSCSVLLIRSDIYKSDRNNKIRTVQKPKGYSAWKYITDETEDVKQELRKLDVIGIDPNKGDLIYATNGKTEIVNGKHKTPTFRYSQNQRRQETRSKHYSKIREEDKAKTKVTEKTVKELEEELSKYNSKSCIFKNVIEYIRKKNEINSKVLKYYSKELYRKLRWYGFINRQRSEARMIRRFRKVFGTPEELVIAYGDLNQSNNHMKYHEPTKGVGMRKIFRKAGYKVYLQNEHKTSKINFITEEEMETFRKRGNPRPWKTDIRKWHGLLRSKNVPNSKSSHILLNRDFNASMNIRKLFKLLLNNKEIPKAYK